MAITRHVCGFECNMYNGGTGSTGTRHWMASTGTGLSISTAVSRNGLTRTLRVAPATSGAQTYVRHDALPVTTQNKAALRFAIYFDTLPTAFCDLVTISSSAGSFAFFNYDPADGNFYIKVASGTGGTAGGTVIQTGQWYVVDLEFDYSAATRTIKCKVNGGTEFTHSAASSVGTMAQLRMGAFVGAAGTGSPVIHYKDVIAEFGVAADTFSYPFGDGKVIALFPNADGTHNFSAAGDFRKGALATATTILGSGNNASPGDTDLYTYVDDVPGSLTEGSIQYGTGLSQGEYVAIRFQDATGETTAPRSVCLVWQTHSAATTANSQGMKYHDGTAEATAVGNVDGSETSAVNFGYNLLNASGSAWTLSELNAFEARWGPAFTGTLDVSPVANLDAVLIEAEFPAAAAGASLAGAATLSITTAAALTTDIPLAGAAALSVTGVAAALSTSIRMAGVATVTLAGTGALATDVRLAGAATLAITGTGDLMAPQQHILGGAATLAVAGTGALTTAIPLAGAATLTVTGAGALATDIRMAGAATASITGAGALATDIRLMGAASLTVAGTASLLTDVRLAGAAALTITGTGDMPSDAAMSGAATVAVTGIGALSTDIFLTGAATLSLTGVAALTTDLRLAGAATLSLTGAAALATDLRLAGAAALTITAGAPVLVVELYLFGAATLSISGTASLSTSILLAGSAVLAIIGGTPLLIIAGGPALLAEVVLSAVERHVTLNAVERVAVLRAVERLVDLGGRMIAGNAARLEARFVKWDGTPADPVNVTLKVFDERRVQVGATYNLSDPPNKVATGHWRAEVVVPTGTRQLIYEFAGTLEGSPVRGAAKLPVVTELTPTE